MGKLLEGVTGGVFDNGWLVEVGEVENFVMFAGGLKK